MARGHGGDGGDGGAVVAVELLGERGGWDTRRHVGGLLWESEKRRKRRKKMKRGCWMGVVLVGCVDGIPGDNESEVLMFSNRVMSVVVVIVIAVVMMMMR